MFNAKYSSFTSETGFKLILMTCSKSLLTLMGIRRKVLFVTQPYTPFKLSLQRIILKPLKKGTFNFFKCGDNWKFSKRTKVALASKRNQTNKSLIHDNVLASVCAFFCISSLAQIQGSNVIL